VSRRWISVAAAVSLVATTACLLWKRRSLRSRRAGKQAKTKGDSIPNLADELMEALELEALENLIEMPSEELQAAFSAASDWVANEGGQALSVQSKLELYGPFKQVNAGDAPDVRPRGIEASMKWDSWVKLKGRTRQEAMAIYVATLDRLCPIWAETSGADLTRKQPRHKPDGGSSMGFAVSTMGQIGDPDQAGDTDETPIGVLCEMIANGEVEGVCSVLDQAPSLAFQKDKAGMTPLHWAADRGEVRIAQKLVSMLESQPASAILGCLNCKDDAGDTPLHYAVNTENVELARLLTRAGADPSIQNEDGDSPLDLAEGQSLWDAAPDALDDIKFRRLKTMGSR